MDNLYSTVYREYADTNSLLPKMIIAGQIAIGNGDFQVPLRRTCIW